MRIDAFTCTQIVLCLCVFSELLLECSAGRRKDKSQKSAMSDQMDVMDDRWRHNEARNHHRNNMADEDMDDDMYDVMDPEDTINLSTNNEVEVRFVVFFNFSLLFGKFFSTLR